MLYKLRLCSFPIIDTYLIIRYSLNRLNNRDYFQTVLVSLKRRVPYHNIREYLNLKRKIFGLFVLLNNKLKFNKSYRT